ncbi:hypothetical protein FC093_05400 [Ilyomonas limi]|uniref:Lipocalin-like domain-containing protein n=1 Tax=Ilyomonas limi TaxID=2575867 RepID=A0A4U3L8F7_9BACT|nr:hypothetical protein [Ilyomonas limi]TKK70186.1 hypothetical protein FC093_05400 [Ilyomonas limi]
MKNRYFILTVTATTLIFTRCKNISPNKADNQLRPDNKTLKQSENIDSISSLEKSSTLHLLQGRWQQVEDKSNFLVFDKNHRREIADGMDKWEDEIFVLSDHCLNESNSVSNEPKEKDKYISCKESDLCWYITSLDSNYLILTYLERGNELIYKRVKE